MTRNTAVAALSVLRGTGHCDRFFVLCGPSFFWVTDQTTARCTGFRPCAAGGICFGPSMSVLGVCCIAVASAGLMMPGVSYEVFGVIDGMLKVAVGARLLFGKPRAA